MKLRPALKKFSDLMEKVLRKNDHKGGWELESNIALLGRLREETDELSAAIQTGAPFEQIQKEAADVANFAMMISDNYGKM